MNLDDGTVDHRVFEIRTGSQSLEHSIKSVSLDPAAKPLEHRIPIAKITRRVTPLRTGSNHPKDGLHEQTRVAPGLAGVCRFAKAMRLNDRPLGVVQSE
ncbi:hypothetical protein AKJ29_15225 [Aliiroseovarius crassostreae]|uniref:Uncharacterized protein n=1 Tax=Aliiroseovarius crassostreae TaxID=154981 RepID=A0A0P7KJW0_9RHOB|nr:hypothetical protein AKJ29_15225 [Aliiroseovarius crassostreae]